jgi:hypothetical protein
MVGDLGLDISGSSEFPIQNCDGWSIRPDNLNRLASVIGKSDTLSQLLAFTAAIVAADAVRSLSMDLNANHSEAAHREKALQDTGRTKEKPVESG